MNRRGFLSSILASGIAPYVITASGVLMPVRKIITLQWPDLEDYEEGYFTPSLEMSGKAIFYNAVTRYTKIGDVVFIGSMRRRQPRIDR